MVHDSLSYSFLNQSCGPGLDVDPVDVDPVDPLTCLLADHFLQVKDYHSDFLNISSYIEHLVFLYVSYSNRFGRDKVSVLCDDEFSYAVLVDLSPLRSMIVTDCIGYDHVSTLLKNMQRRKILTDAHISSLCRATSVSQEVLMKHICSHISSIDRLVLVAEISFLLHTTYEDDFDALLSMEKKLSTSSSQSKLIDKVLYEVKQMYVKNTRHGNVLKIRNKRTKRYLKNCMNNLQRHIAASIIQKHYLAAYYNPTYHICRRKVLNMHELDAIDLKR